MIHKIPYLLVVASLVIAAVPLAADDALARKYTDEVVTALSADLNRQQSMRSPQQADIYRLKNRLLNAQLLAAKLRGDKAQQKTLRNILLQNQVTRYARDLKRLEEQAKRGYAGFPQLRIAKLRLLIAKQKIAEQSADRQAVSEIIDAAVVIEVEHLEALQQQVSRDYAPTSQVLDQKLRIARMIAEQRVTLPTPEP